MKNILSETQRNRLVKKTQQRIKEVIDLDGEMSLDEQTKIADEFIAEELPKEIARIESVKHIREELEKVEEEKLIEE